MKTDNSRFEEANKLLENVKTLDLGSGEGLPTSKVVDIEKITVMDINEERLKINKAKIKICGRITKLPFKKKSFPQVTLFEVIEHIEKKEDRKKVFKEVLRVLEKNGKFVLSTPNYNRLSTHLRNFVRKPRKYPYKNADIKGVPETGYHYFEYTKEELKMELILLGFRKVKVYSKRVFIPLSKIFFNIKSSIGTTLYCVAEK